MTETPAMREAFETWAERNALNLQRGPNSTEYEKGFTVDAWVAWQAAYQAARSRPSPVSVEEAKAAWNDVPVFEEVYGPNSERNRAHFYALCFVFFERHRETINRVLAHVAGETLQSGDGKDAG